MRVWSAKSQAIGFSRWRPPRIVVVLGLSTGPPFRWDIPRHPSGGGVVSKRTVPPEVIRRMIHKNTVDSARLEGREIPADYVRAPNVQEFMTSCWCAVR